MADPLDLIPLTHETAASIRARIDADVNAGIDTTDARYIDTTAGGFYWDTTQGLVLEFERVYDLLGTEYLAAALLMFSFGDYLDSHGEALGVPRKDAVAATGVVTVTGDDGTLIPTDVEFSVPEASPDTDPIIFVPTAEATITGGTADVPVVAEDPGTDGNVAAGTITLISGADVATVTNTEATDGGEDVEDDESYRSRLLLALQAPVGSGTKADYQRWALAYGGIGFVTVEPNWAGGGTVRLTITDPDNRPVPSGTVTGLQQLLDPVPGEGDGQAPIGHTVTVITPSTVTVDVNATLAFSTGYTLDGTAGTVATRAAILAALSAYVDRLAPGEDVVHNHVLARFFEVPGQDDQSAVFNVTGLTLNGGAGDVAIPSTSVAALGTVVLA